MIERSPDANHAHHFQTLDLLRGIAAISVVIYHFSSRMEMNGLFFHGYLAVDFFFCLSGYVIHHAYQAKLVAGRLTLNDFLRLRIVRLMPLVILGNILAALIDIFRPGQFSSATHVADIAIVLVLACLLLPTLWKTTLEDTTYPLNGPVWSLFFEFFANAIYAILSQFTHRKLTFQIVAGVSFLILAHTAFLYGNIHFGPHADQFLLGFPRVCFSFFAGVLLSEIRWKAPRLNRIFAIIPLIAIISIPKIPNQYASAAFDIAAIGVIFPLVIVFAARCFSDDRLSVLSGQISYPLYCIHYPFVRVLSVIFRYAAWGSPMNVLAAFVSAGALAVVSLFIFKHYDEPVRKQLSRRFLNRAKTLIPATEIVGLRGKEER